MAKQSPLYRGIYAYDATNKPNGTSIKASPKYRGIYTYVVANKPSGVMALMSSPQGQVTEFRNNVTGRSVGEAPEQQPAPTNGKTWDKLYTHADIDEYVKDNDLETPDTWQEMTILQKKDWISKNA